MQIITMNLGELDTSCYLLASDEGNAAMIDPAGDVDRIIEALSENSLVLKKYCSPTDISTTRVQ